MYEGLHMASQRFLHAVQGKMYEKHACAKDLKQNSAQAAAKVPARRMRYVTGD